ncbi:MAG: hypothetical protein LBJ00_04320 [Planctomycetaceae bacterium]|jgi:hypothetical protein|nr:hypothetical protein [Planctomycetaceae bacterium]
MKKTIVSTCLGTAICFCIVSSGIVNAQPAREGHHDKTRENDRQGKLQKDVRANVAQQIEAAYERGFKDGVAAGEKFDKGKREGRKFNQTRHHQKQNFHKGESGRYHGQGFPKGERYHEQGFPKSEFGRYHRQGFPKSEFGRYHEQGFPKGEFGRYHGQGFPKGEFGFAPKGFQHKEIAKALPKKHEHGKANKPDGKQFKRDSFGKKKNELARDFDGKKHFAKPDIAKPERNKKGIGKNEPPKKPRQHTPKENKS